MSVLNVHAEMFGHEYIMNIKNMDDMSAPQKAKPKHLDRPLMMGCSTNQSSIYQEKEVSENKVGFCYFS